MEKYVENSIVMTNFLYQLKHIGNCFESSRGKYYIHFNEGIYKLFDVVINPSVSIVNSEKKEGEYYVAVPLFVMDVFPCDKDENKLLDLYNKAGVSECWFVNWKKRLVEIYMFDDDGNGGTKPYLQKTVNEGNKEDLMIIMFRQKMSFDDLFQMKAPPQTIKGYEFRVEWSIEDKYYIGEVPELPGCMADSRTLEELYQELEEHINMWIEVNTERGLPIPEPLFEVKRREYKYCRDIMWSVEDDAFVASVAELPGCHAKGRTVVETMKNLDLAIDVWITTAKEENRAIPSPLYYEPIEYEEVPENEKIPYYDSVSGTWKVVMEWGREEGDAIYVASEFVKDSLYYPFHCEPSWKEEHHNHAHDFASVVSFLLKKPDFFSIVGFEEYYSKQEQELLANLKMKLHIPNEETIAAIEEVEKMKKNPLLYKSYTSAEELRAELQKDNESED